MLAEGRTGLCGQSEGTKGYLDAAWSGKPGPGRGSFKSVRFWPLASLSTGLVVLGAGSSGNHSQRLHKTAQVHPSA